LISKVRDMEVVQVRQEENETRRNRLGASDQEVIAFGQSGSRVGSLCGVAARCQRKTVTDLASQGSVGEKGSRHG
jgi:protein tyrosine phosphatase (PTP) superfamily phosphohydrolase (DUF442 family)